VAEGQREAVTAFHVISFGFETHIDCGIEPRAGDRTGVALWRWNGLNSIRKASRTGKWEIFDWTSLTAAGFDAEFIKESGYHEGILKDINMQARGTIREVFLCSNPRVRFLMLA
jgi:hypothetical protein